MSLARADQWFAYLLENVPGARRGSEKPAGTATWIGTKGHASDDAALTEARGELERRAKVAKADRVRT